MVKHIKDIAIIALLVVVLFQTCGKKGITHESRTLIHSDTTYVTEKPVIMEKHFHHSTPVRIVEHWHTVTQVDTLAVIQDYFRARYYADSVVTDTVQYYWQARISRNVLDSFSIKTRFQPRTKIITNSYEVNRPAVGLMVLYANSTPYIGAFGTWQRKRISVSGGLSPMNGGAFLLGIGWKVGK